MTIAAQDPISKIPEYKVCAGRESRKASSAAGRMPTELEPSNESVI